MTISFWITLDADSTGTWRTIFHKGASPNVRTATMMLRPNERRIEASISTTRETVEALTTDHVLALGVPTHIAFVLEGRTQRIYVNGILDAESTTEGDVIFNDGPFMIGKDLWHDGIEGTLQEFQVFPRSLKEGEIMEFSDNVHVPSVFSFNADGKLNGKDYVIAPHDPVFETPEYSILMWLTLHEDPNQIQDWSAIFHHGQDSANRAPAFFLEPFTGKMYAALSTQSSANTGMTIQTPLKRDVPTHIAFVVKHDELTLYVNGAHAGGITLPGPVATAEGPLYVGGSPWLNSVDSKITGFQILPTSLDAVQISQYMALDERF